MNNEPKVLREDIWDAWQQARHDVFLVTTSAGLKKNGALVMGAGLAKQVCDRFPGIDAAFGREIAARRAGASSGPRYGIIISDHWKERAPTWGAFQVRNQDWSGDAQPYLICNSVITLNNWLKANPDATVALNYPGIGSGNLEEDEVWPLVKWLDPERVVIYRND